MIRKLLSFACFVLVFFAAAAGQSTWQKVRIDDGKFSVILPCTPKFKTEDVTNLGKTSPLKTYSCLRDNVYYVAAVTDFPKAFNEKVALDQSRDDFVKGFEGKLTAEKTFSFLTHTGREVWTRSVDPKDESVAVFRFIFVGSRLYSLGVAKRASVTTAMENAKYFSSFTLES